MNIIGFCKDCGAEINLFENEINDCTYECPECKTKLTFEELVSIEDRKMEDIEGQLEYEDVLSECKILYKDSTNEIGIETVARLVMEMDRHQNKVYDIVGKISIMLENPNVIETLMRRFKKIKKE